MKAKKNNLILWAIGLMCFTLTSCGLGGYAMGGFGGMGMGSSVPGLPYYLQPNVALQNSINQINSNMQQAAAAGLLNPAPVSSSSYSGGNYSSYSSGVQSSSGSSKQKRDGLCPTCYGDGKCHQCHGSGMRTDNMFGSGTSTKDKCGICGGNGRCTRCNGRGRV